MGCLVLLFALISPRLAIIITALSNDYLSRSMNGNLLPLLGFFLLPWTMLAYAWMYDAGGGRTVEGIEWVLVGVAVLIDLGSLLGGGRSRRD